MIQVACAVLAAAVSLMVWVSIKPQDLLTLFPYLMAAVVGVAANLLINLMLTRRRPAANPTDLIPADIAQPSAAQAIKPAKPTFPTVRYVTTRGIARVGAKTTFKVHMRDFSLVVHAIRKRGGILECELEILDGPGWLTAIGDARRVDIKGAFPGSRFTMVTRADSSKTLLLEFDLQGDQPKMFALYVDHIDPHAKEIHYVACVIGGYSLDLVFS